MSQVERFLWNVREHGMERFPVSGTAQRFAKSIRYLLSRRFLHEKKMYAFSFIPIYMNLIQRSVLCERITHDVYSFI